MDPPKDSSSAENSTKLEQEGENNWNCKNPSNQASTSDNVGNVFTSGSNHSSGFVPLNGPRATHSNTLPSIESGQQSNRQNENISESLNYQSGTSQSQFGHRVNNSHTDENEPIAGCSNASNSTCENGTEPSPEVLICQRHKACFDRAGSSSAPSTSGTSRACDASDNNCRENRKRPSSLKLNRPNIDAEDSSSDTGNDDYSLGSEDGCIYTYRGGEHLADLPSSFFSLDMGLPIDMHMMMLPNFQGQQQGAAAAREPDSRASSPDMDFLEMDFDPGPSCEVDTGDESSPDADLDAVSNMPVENEPVVRAISPEYLEGARYNPISLPVATSSHIADDTTNVPSTSRGIVSGQGDNKHAPENTNSHSCGPYITHVNIRGEQLLVRRTMSYGAVHEPDSLHISSGDLVSPREILNYDEEHVEGPFAYQINQGEKPTFDSGNLSSALYHLTMVKKLMAENTTSDAEGLDVHMPAEKRADPEPPSGEATAGSSASGVGCVEAPQSMVWSEREACERQVTQIATSACGATAVVNVFIALGVPVNLEKINLAVGTRQRANSAPLPRYLLSRAVAGCTAADLVSGIQRASDSLVTARFFPTYPERAVSLSHWLADWISLGAVPILTLNLQVGCEGDIPDAWHHQMVFGVSSRGVYLCNPVECVSEAALWPRLTSPSILLVRTRDVLTRFTASTDLTPLMYVPDRRFHTHNVLGQVANVIREWRSGGCSKHTRTRHVRVPCGYQAGVTVAALTGSEAHRRLMHAPQLPILPPTQPPRDK